MNQWDADAGTSQAALRGHHGTFLLLDLGGGGTAARQAGPASINVGNCFVIPFSELGAVSCAE